MTNRIHGDEAMRVTVTISEATNPLLYRRLQGCANSGEKHSRVLRQIAEKALLFDEFRKITGLQLVESQQDFQKSAINSEPRILRNHEDIKPEVQKSSLTENDVNEDFEAKNAPAAAGQQDENFVVNTPPVLTTKNELKYSGARELAMAMARNGLLR